MWKKFLEKYTGIGILTATYFTCLITFITAYLHPTRSAIVTINTYNEANIELILLIITFPVICRYIYREMV